jgi:hypothetical protein
MAGKIKRWQAARLHRLLQPSVGLLYRLRERMQKVGYVPSDRLYALVCKAYDALHAVYVDVHYLSCDGVGRKSDE